MTRILRVTHADATNPARKKNLRPIEDQTKGVSLTTEDGLETRPYITAARTSPEVCVSPHALAPGAHPLAIEGSLLALPDGVVGRMLAAVASLANRE